MTAVTNTDAEPAREELLERAAALVPVLAERAAHTEQLRRIPPENVADLLASDLHRIAVPRRFGGLDTSYDVMLEAGCELGRGCGATAWCYSLWSAHAWLVGHWPLAAQEEVFGAGPDVLCSSSFAPGGARAEPVAGGFRLSGRWEFSSGCDAAGWLLLGAPGPDGPMWLLVPRGDYTIVDTWFVSGLCGTGSKDITIEDAFVPEHRVLRNPFVAGASEVNGWELHGQPQYRLPITCLLVWDLVTPLIGIALGAIEEFTRRFHGTKGRGRTAESAVIQVRLAEASAQVAAARALLRQDVREMLAKAARGHSFTELEVARYTRDKAFVTRLCGQAVNGLFEVSGGHALFSSDPLQRMHRDAIAVAHRDGLILEFAGTPYARAVLGVEQPPPAAR